ncbi:hypothetical protein GCM10009730_50180 [Streptomyces albidochromogenes]
MDIAPDVKQALLSSGAGRGSVVPPQLPCYALALRADDQFGGLVRLRDKDGDGTADLYVSAVGILRCLAHPAASPPRAPRSTARRPSTASLNNFLEGRSRRRRTNAGSTSGRPERSRVGAAGSDCRCGVLCVHHDGQ